MVCHHKKGDLMSHILVIDDEPRLRELVRSFLQIDGHDVVTAENGREGLRMAEATRFDLVITDIIMPEQDGFEVIQALVSQTGAPKVIGITGGSRNLRSDYLLNMAQLLGSVKVLKKPLSYEILHAAVAEVLSP